MAAEDLGSNAQNTLGSDILPQNTGVTDQQQDEVDEVIRKAKVEVEGKRFLTKALNSQVVPPAETSSAIRVPEPQSFYSRSPSGGFRINPFLSNRPQRRVSYSEVDLSPEEVELGTNRRAGPINYADSNELSKNTPRQKIFDAGAVTSEDLRLREISLKETLDLFKFYNTFELPSFDLKPLINRYRDYFPVTAETLQFANIRRRFQQTRLFEIFEYTGIFSNREGRANLWRQIKRLKAEEKEYARDGYPMRGLNHTAGHIARGAGAALMEDPEHVNHAVHSMRQFISSQTRQIAEAYASKPMRSDIVVIGGGPETSAIVSQLRLFYPEANIIVVSASPGGIWNGAFWDTNSRARKNDPRNPYNVPRRERGNTTPVGPSFDRSVLQIADADSKTKDGFYDMFAPGGMVAFPTIFNQILNSKVVKGWADADPSTQYTNIKCVDVNTEFGSFKINADIIIKVPGLGKETSAFLDGKSTQFFGRSEKELEELVKQIEDGVNPSEYRIPQLLTLQALTAIVDAARTHKVPLKKVFKNLKMPIGVIGKANGANSICEFLAGQSHEGDIFDEMPAIEVINSQSDSVAGAVAFCNSKRYRPNLLKRAMSSTPPTYRRGRVVGINRINVEDEEGNIQRMAEVIYRDPFTGIENQKVQYGTIFQATGSFKPDRGISARGQPLRSVNSYPFGLLDSNGWYIMGAGAGIRSQSYPADVRGLFFDNGPANVNALWLHNNSASHLVVYELAPKMRAIFDRKKAAQAKAA